MTICRRWFLWVQLVSYVSCILVLIPRAVSPLMALVVSVSYLYDNVYVRLQTSLLAEGSDDEDASAWVRKTRDMEKQKQEAAKRVSYHTHICFFVCCVRDQF